MENKKIGEPRMASSLFCLCWLVYFTSYIGRLNYSSAMTVMIEDGVLTAARAGAISMAYFFAYAAGQLINGLLGDKVHPGRMIFMGIGASGLLNCFMGLYSGFTFLLIIWCLNGYVQSMIWPPIIRLFSQLLEEKKKVKYCVDIISTQALGTLASYLMSALVIGLFGWKSVFFTAAVLLMAAALIWRKGFSRIEMFVRLHGIPAKAAEGDEGEGNGGEGDRIEGDVGERGKGLRPDKRKSLVTVIITSGLLSILIPVIVHGILKDGVTAWVPTYLSQTFLAPPSLAILVTTVLPLVNLTGAYAAQYLYKRLHQNELWTAFVFFGTAFIALLLLWWLGGVSMVFTVALLSIITSSMMAVNTLFINLLPLRFEKYGRVSAVSGIFNSAAYMGTAISTFTIGIMVERFGWKNTIFGWLVITAVATVICLVVGHGKLEYMKKETENT